jgi:hypothetical protein
VATNREIRLVPRPPVGRDEVERLAGKAGWRHGRTHDGPLEIIWLSPERETGIHWIEDDTMMVRYLVVEGPAAEPTAAFIRDEMDVFDTSSFVEYFAGLDDEIDVMNAVRMLGVHCARSPFEPNLYPLFRDALAHPVPLVRRIAMLAVAVVRWPEFEPLLAHLSTNDLDADVRDEAIETLAILSGSAG